MASNDPSSDLLDRALAGQSSQTRARVTDLAYRMGLDVNDEFFILCIGFGILQSTIEEAPRDWQDLFRSFASELETWSRNFIAILDQSSQQAQTTAHLTETLRESNSTLRELLRALLKLISTSQNTARNSDNLHSKLESFKSALDSRLSEIERQHARLSDQLTDWRANLSDRSATSLRDDKTLYLAIGAVIGLGLGYLIWQRPHVVSPPAAPTAAVRTL